MKKILLQLTIIAALFLQACNNKPLEDTKLEKYDLTITSPKLDAPPEFTDFKPTETDTEFSRYDFNMGGSARVNVIEIAANAYPTDTAMLKEAVSKSADFIELIETRQLKNGAFGVVYKMTGSGGGPIKYYNFYFKKGNRYFKMEPVFNSELNDLDQQIAAYESLK